MRFRDIPPYVRLALRVVSLTAIARGEQQVPTNNRCTRVIQVPYCVATALKAYKT